MLCRHAVLVALVIGSHVSAGPPEPPPPPSYQVQLNYQIRSDGNERLPKYFAMMKTLASLGFVRDPEEVVADDEPENGKYHRMSGTLPSKNVPQLLNQKFTQSMLVFPAGTKLPNKGSRVRVDMSLPTGMSAPTQQSLARQSAEAMRRDLGFEEGFGYDHRDYSRLLGSLPVENLNKLLEGVHELPSAKTMGPPLRDRSPIRLILARPDFPVPKGWVRGTAPPPAQAKFTPDLRALLSGPDAGKPTRMEVILGSTPPTNSPQWVEKIENLGATVEGRTGPLVSVLGVPSTVAPRLAEMPDVAHVRLPRQASRVVSLLGRDSPDKWNAVEASGLTQLHAMGKRGQGTRVALISDDFAGWEKLRGRKDGMRPLPDPTLLDFTAERSRDLLPDAMPGGKGEGYGTRCARAFLQAAPEAELTLVRIDGKAPYMLQNVARAINGDLLRTLSMEQRAFELRDDRTRLQRKSEDLLAERERVLRNPVGDAEGQKPIQEYRKRQAAFDIEEKGFEERRHRFFQLYKALEQLKGIRVVANTLVWTDGYPVDGTSALSRYFDDRPFRAALWFQAAGDSGGQAWTGLLQDRDNNGLIEFSAGETAKLPAGSWSPEMNFLGWRGSNGEKSAQLPAGARLRLSLQWRETHDPTPLAGGDDVYRQPLAKFDVLLVFQPDPEGKKQPADDLEIVARTSGASVRLNQSANSATYEQTLETTITKPGRYALVIVGRLPDGITAPGENTLPGIKRTSEIRPRLFVQTLSGPGRAVWHDFATNLSALGMPAEARAVVAVAAADASSRIRESSADGPPANQALMTKPDVLAFDQGGGTGEAASFAAGFAASAWPMAGTLFGVMERMRIPQGGLLRIPEASPRAR